MTVTKITPEWNLDDTVENADWIKLGWELPPYGSKEFFEQVPYEKLDWFRTTQVYKNAVANGLIHDDEWVADYCKPAAVVDEFIDELLSVIKNGPPVKKSDEFDGILQEMPEVEKPWQLEFEAEAMELSNKAISLCDPEDRDGQRISGKACAATRDAYNDVFERDDYATVHQRAHDLHRRAAVHYRYYSNNAKAADAHDAVADVHEKAKRRDYKEVAEVAKGSIDPAANEAAPHEASDEQKHAGNYKMGHINVGGIDITIENPAGTRRRPEWETMKAHYGYIKRTEGADGDHTDCFVKPGTDDSWNGPVFVVDQYKPDGTFDEHKALIGYLSQKSAVKAYLGSYQAGWQLGPVTRLSWNEFKSWVSEKVHDEPLSSRN